MKVYAVIRLARKSSSHDAAVQRSRRDSFPAGRLAKLRAMCLMVVKLAGSCSVTEVGGWIPSALRANDDETSTPRKFTLEGVR